MLPIFCFVSKDAISPVKRRTNLALYSPQIGNDVFFTHKCMNLSPHSF